jgi:tRNA-dihydrouridine synthase
MLLSLAPMEGITGYVFRNVHHAFFGRWTDRYYTPFVVCTYTKRIKTREKRDVLPENNKGVPLIPQLLSNKAEEFLFTARTMAELGYREVNLNLGCPVGTVTAKKKGSGFLTVPDELDRFLDAIFEGAEQILVTREDGSTGPLAISVKTRLGFTDVQEADRLFAIYEKYPLSDLIIHARTRAEQYAGQPELSAFLKILSSSHLPITYNGNVFTKEDAAYVAALSGEKLSGIMIGRGLVDDPSLTRQIRGGKPASKEELKAFHRALYEGYLSQYGDGRDAAGDPVVIGRMKEVWSHLGNLFEDPGHYRKDIHKARTRASYEAAVRCLFDNCPLVPRAPGIGQSKSGAES